MYMCRDDCASLTFCMYCKSMILGNLLCLKVLIASKLRPYSKHGISHTEYNYYIQN